MEFDACQPDGVWLRYGCCCALELGGGSDRPVCCRADTGDWCRWGGATVGELPAWPADYLLPVCGTPAGPLRRTGETLGVQLPGLDLECALCGGDGMCDGRLDEYRDSLKPGARFANALDRNVPSDDPCPGLLFRLSVRVI